MADRYLIVFDKKRAPSKGYFGEVLYPRPFDTKTDARKFILKVLKDKRQFFGATIYTAGEIGDKGQFLGTDFERFSTSRESIGSRTVKGKKAYYVKSTFRNPSIDGKIVNADGTLSKTKIDEWTEKRDPRYWDLDL